MKNILICAVLLTAGTLAFGQTGLPKTVLSTDPAVADILSSLSHPTPATIEVNEIKVPSGEVLKCEAYTRGNYTESTCSPHARFEEIHQVILSSRSRANR